MARTKIEKSLPLIMRENEVKPHTARKDLSDSRLGSAVSCQVDNNFDRWKAISCSCSDVTSNAS
jgi:hypothetical protein